MSVPVSEQTSNPTAEPKPYRCRHIFTEGHQCGSPALRGEPLCFYHHAGRRPATHQTIHDLTFVVLPAPEDFHAIQRGLSEVLRLSATHQIDHRHASVLTRCLAVASANLARIARQQKHALPITDMVQDFVHDPLLGTLALPPGHLINPAEPLPDQAPVLTPKPIIERIRNPEADAQSAARWAKVEQELAAHNLARANRHQPTPSPEPCPEPSPEASAEASQTPQELTPRASPVQTYPPSNQDFGLLGENIFASPAGNLHPLALATQ